MLSSLPPSVLNVLEGERSGGNFNPLHNATLGEWELATDHAISGSQNADVDRFAELMAAPRLRLLVACAIALLALPLRASSPKFFQAATQADFLKGDVENLSIDSRGELALGPATEVVYETAAPFLWAVQGQADGTLYAGTGNEGTGLQDRFGRQGLGLLRRP